MEYVSVVLDGCNVTALANIKLGRKATMKSVSSLFFCDSIDEGRKLITFGLRIFLR